MRTETDGLKIPSSSSVRFFCVPTVLFSHSELNA
jgi:hypothetical protein